MARPILSGSLSFGLLRVPVSLMSGERRADLSFRMLDARDSTPIRYVRVNAETGEEVPWKDIVTAFEYDESSYVAIEKDDIAAAAPESHEWIDVEAFVDAASIGIRFYEKPDILTPGKKAENGYVLLRETLKSTGTVGIARIVIRTREYICAVMPENDALELVLLRYPQELVVFDEYTLPAGKAADYRVTPKELEMAEHLILSMCSPWKPQEYRDEFRERLAEIIRTRVKAAGATIKPEEPVAREQTANNVVDFMALLKKSLASKKRTPTEPAPSSTPPPKPAPDKPAPEKSAPGKSAPAKSAPARTPAKRERKA